MVVAETKEHTEVEEAVKPLYAFFAPFFVAYIGLSVDLGALVDAGVLLLLTVLAVLTSSWALGSGRAASTAATGR
jgi:Kef-type K+ transport system membrane component KefB